MTLIKHHLIGPLTDAFIRIGVAPFRGRPSYSLFRWAQENRDSKVPKSHALYNLIKEPEWDTTFALSRSALLWLWDLGLSAQPRCIVDVGGGRSTVMFALLARYRHLIQGTTTKVISIEHDIEWQAKTAAALNREKLAGYVHQLLIPLRRCSLNKEIGQTYDIENSPLSDVLTLKEVDFLLIDGPPGGEVGRHYALMAMIKYASFGSSIFIDDVERPAMKYLLDWWLTDPLFGLTLKGVLPFEGGFAWLVKRSL